MNNEASSIGAKGATVQTPLHITPQSVQLIYYLQSFLAQCKNFGSQDSQNRLLDLQCILLRYFIAHLNQKKARIFSFNRGFPDSQKAEQSFTVKFLHGIETILANKYLPIRYYAILSEIMGSENAGIAEMIGQVIEGKITVTQEQREEWKAIAKLSKIFTPRQTEDIISKLRFKYQAPSSLQEGLSKDPNKKIIILIIRMLLLNQNGIALAQLRSHNLLHDLESICLHQINKFLKSRHGGENGFAIQPMSIINDGQQRPSSNLTSIEPYFSLLLTLLIGGRQYQQNQEAQGSPSHLGEFLAYFYRTALDRTVTILSREDTKLSLQLIARAIKEQGLFNRNKDELLEIMEVITLFTINFQRQNTYLVEMLNNGNSIRLAEQSTRISIANGLHSQQASNVPQLVMLNRNLQDLQLNEIFEEGILNLVKLESTLDNSFQEASASIKYLNSLLRYLQLLRKNDESIGSAIFFKLKLIGILVKNYGASNEQLKSALQTLTHKIVKSFDYILASADSAHIQDILKLLFSIIIKDLGREDLTVFLMQELQKVFKKSAYNSLMCDTFFEMAHILDDKKDSSKTCVHIFHTQISIINQLWHDQQIDDLSNESFSVLLKSLALSLEKSDMTKNNNHSIKSLGHSTQNPKVYQHFVQMWIVIFSYLTEHENSKFNFKPELIKLASLTPYLVYIQEFSLMLRIGHNKDVLERFIQVAFQKFPGLSSGVAVGGSGIPMTSQQKEEALKQTKHTQQQSKPTQNAIEIHDDEEEGEEENDLGFGEKLFLSLFAQIQEYRMHSLSSVSERLPLLPAHPNNFVESLLTVFVNEKIDSEIFINKLDKLTSDLFDIYLANLKDADQDSLKEKIQIQDFTFLLKSSCHLQKRLSSKSKAFLQSYTDNYPFMLLKPKVLATLLDILDAINSEMYKSYDSLSHAIRLPTTGESIYLQSRQQAKHEILQDLSNFCSDMLIYAAIISTDELNKTFEAYKTQIGSLIHQNRSQSSLTSGDAQPSYQQHYGIGFFEYLRSNLDFSRVDLALVQSSISMDNQLPLNFHSLKNLAFTKPWKFVKAIQELKKQTPNGLFFSAAGSYHHVFNVQKKSQQSQIERILTLKPFASPQSSPNGTPLRSIQQYTIEIGQRLQHASTHQIYQDLQAKVKKQIMQLDLYHAVKQMLKYKTKEEAYQVLKQVTTSQRYQSQEKKSLHIRSMLYGPHVQNMKTSSILTQSQAGVPVHSMIRGGYHESQMFQGMPFTVRDTQKLGKTLQKLVHQINRKQFMQDLSAKIEGTVGLLVSLLISLEEGSKSQVALNSLSLQILSLLAQFPACSLTPQAFNAYNIASNLLQSHPILKKQLHSLLPLSLNIALAKIQSHSTTQDPDQVIKAFEIANHLKQELSEVNEDLGIVRMIDLLINDPVVQYDYHRVNSNQSQESLKFKLNTNWMQELNQKSILRYVDSVLQWIESSSIAMIGDQQKGLQLLCKVFKILVNGVQRIVIKSNGIKGFTQISLKIINTGFKLVECQKIRFRNKSDAKVLITENIARLQTLTYDFMMKFLQKQQLNAQTNLNLEFKEVITLILDCKYLIESNQHTDPTSQSQDLLKLIQISHLRQNQELIYQCLTKTLYVYNPQQQVPHKRSFMSPLDRSLSQIEHPGFKGYNLMNYQQVSRDDINGTDFRIESMLSLYLLTYQQQTILAWNYNEKMKEIKTIPQSHLDLAQFSERVKLMIQRYPKIAVQLYSKVGTNVKILEILKPALSQDIQKRPNIYQYSPDALEIYLDQLYIQGKLKSSLKEFKPIIAEWRCWNFVKLFKYLGFKYNGEYFLNQLALKPFEFVKSKTILQYLPQMFQSLRNDCQNQIQYFLIKKCKEFASVAHNVLWYCKVEEEPDHSKGRKVPLPLRENLHEVTVILRDNILSHMTPEALQFFNTETEFFERITSISGELMPKMSKDEKKAKIAQRLVEYSKNIPESVYLPTNTNCRVVGIVTTSGAPMQSAARVPIMISFEVEDYPGPDNDPVLMSGLQQHSLNHQSTTNVSIQQQPISKNQAMANIASSFQEFKLASIGRQQSNMSGNSKKQLQKKSSRRRGSTRRHLDNDQDLLDNNDESIVVDEQSHVPIRSDDDEDDDVINQLAKKGNTPLKDASNQLSDFDSDDEQIQNVSPRSTPASQIAILNIKSRLQNYNFVANRNEKKFSGTFINTISQLKLGQGAIYPPKISQSFIQNEDLIPPHILSHRLQSSPMFIQTVEFNEQINEEQKINIVKTNTENDEKSTTKQGAKGIIYSDKKPAGQFYLSGVYNERMIASMKTGNVAKTTVSEIEQRKAIYNPILDLQANRRKMQMHTPKALNARGKRKSIMIRDQNGGSNNLTEQFSPVKTNLQLGQQNSIRIVSCIFKVNDDLRQDIIALQVIKLFQKIFKKNDLDLFVAPYKCISNRTGEDRTLGGIIECVPNSHSRDQLGKAFEIDLYQYFLKKFGTEHSSEFKLARLNFIKSLSSYSVVSYILQIKDRHNGNIMIDDWGHIIHIDFGFIFDWSPGKDMRFESADFKLTKEFIDILGGDMDAEAYQLYVTKTIQAYLAIREHYSEFRNLIQLMHYSGFPCFKEQSLLKLEERFRLDLNVLEAANHMRLLINNCHDKWSTKFYDRIQYLQNKIVF